MSTTFARRLDKLILSAISCLIFCALPATADDTCSVLRLYHPIAEGFETAAIVDGGTSYFAVTNDYVLSLERTVGDPPGTVAFTSNGTSAIMTYTAGSQTEGGGTKRCCQTICGPVQCPANVDLVTLRCSSLFAGCCQTCLTECTSGWNECPYRGTLELNEP
jgi:hypothetical protein